LFDLDKAQFPTTWIKQLEMLKTNLIVYEIDKSSNPEEVKTITERFKTLSDKTIKKIEVIQNADIWKIYTIESERLKKKRKGQPEVK
jgi:hypothetical protein